MEPRRRYIQREHAHASCLTDLEPKTALFQQPKRSNLPYATIPAWQREQNAFPMSGKTEYSVSSLLSPYLGTRTSTDPKRTDNKVVFCTGGAGTICSVQVKALVYLGANAFIIGRNATKTESMAAEMARLRPGAKVIGMGNLDVRKIEDMNKAVERCVEELGGIDFVM